MQVPHSSTELLIKEKSKELYFTMGKLNVSTNEIAEFAGVTRTVVNYYFQNKSNLFQIIYGEISAEIDYELELIYTSTIDFKSKVELLIDYFIQIRLKYPYLEIVNIFHTHEIATCKNYLDTPVAGESLNIFLAEVEQQMQEKTIISYEPINFLINIISLISYPLIMKPFFEKLYKMKESEFDSIYQDRKNIILKLLFKD